MLSLTPSQVTASIDWCEENYEWSFFVAEWWNTVRTSLFSTINVPLLRRER